MPLYLAASFGVHFLGAFCALLFFESFVSPRIGGNLLLRSVFFAIALFAAATAAELLAGAYLAVMAWKILAGFVLYTLALALLYKGDFLQKIILVGIWLFLDNMATTIVQLLTAIPADEAGLVFNLPSFLSSLLARAVLLLIVLMVRYFTRSRGGVEAKLNNPRWLVFLTLPVLSILTIAAMLQYYDEASGGRSVILLLCIGWLVVNALAFQFLQRVEDREQRWLQSRQMRRIASAEVKSLQALSAANRRQRQLTHDFENHLLALKNLMDDGEFKKAHEYVESISGTMQAEAEHAHSGHAVVDTVLNQKIGAAAAKGINVATNISNLSGLAMADDDIVSVLANLLDNAIEACEKVTEGSRVISVKLVMEDGSLVLSVKNPVARPVQVVGGRIATSKTDGEAHGIGLQSIQNALDKYDSTHAIKCENGHFIFSALVDFE